MVIVVSGEVVETVHIVESLRICEGFAKFLDATVDIAHVHVDFLYLLTVDTSAETEHAVSGGVLRANIHDKVLGLEYACFHFLHLAVFSIHDSVKSVWRSFSMLTGLMAGSSS